MRKRWKPESSPSPGGYIAKLEHMVDSSVARKRNAHGSPKVQEPLDPLFDMIDTRLGQMLTKSSKIDSELEDLETRSRSGSRVPASPSPFRERQLAPPALAKETLRGDDDMFSALYEALSGLAAEVAAVREEQRILSVQVGELYRALLAEEL
jgi:hypothetical protein